MKKVLLVLFLAINLLSNAQYRTVDWKTYVEDVVYLSDSTFSLTTNPEDLNDVGVSQAGNYFVDFVGNRYKVLSFVGNTLTVYDIHKRGIAPQSSKIGRVYQSVGNGIAEFIGGIDLTPLDQSARWKIVAADNELFWRRTEFLNDRIDSTIGAIPLKATTIEAVTALDTDRYMTPSNVALYSELNYVPHSGAKDDLYMDTFNVQANSATVNYVDFADSITDIEWKSGRLFFDKIKNNLVFYDSIQNTAVDLAKEMVVDGINSTGSIITNGQIIYVDTTVAEIPLFKLAKSDAVATATGVIGMATHDIGIGGAGKVATKGLVHDLPTAGLVPGKAVYISATAYGDLTGVKPEYPYFPIQIGICFKAHATEGIIYVDVIGRPEDIQDNYFNSIIYESFDFRITSDGTTVTGTLTNSNGDDHLNLRFADGIYTLDLTTPKTITLVPGTDSIPQAQYVYFRKSTKEIEVSTSEWCTDEEFIPIAEVVLRRALSTQAEGALRNQNINNHLADTNGQGHMYDEGYRIRKLPAEWDIGVAPTMTINSAASPDNVWFSSTPGEVLQMHPQSFPAQDMALGDDIHIVNHPTEPYQTVTDLNTQLLDATGASMASKYFTIIIFGVVNKSGEQSHIFANLPAGSDNNSVDAQLKAIYTIPRLFKGVAFLMASYTFSHLPASGGTWTLESSTDLRGYYPNLTVGSGIGISGYTNFLQLLDTPSSFTGAGNKIVKVSAGEAVLEYSTVTESLGALANITTINTNLFGTTSNWYTAYNDKINSLAFSGTTTKTLTLTQQDLGTVVGSFTDLNTTYTSSGGILLTGTNFAHVNSITAGSFGDAGISRTLAFGNTFVTPFVNYDLNGHITTKSNLILTLPDNPNTDSQTLGIDSLDRVFTINISGATSPIKFEDTNTTYDLSQYQQDSDTTTFDGTKYDDRFGNTAYGWGDHAGLYEVPLTFSTGLNRTGNTITNTITQYTDALARLSISETILGIDYLNTTGVFSLTSGYVIPQSIWVDLWNNTADSIPELRADINTNTTKIDSFITVSDVATVLDVVTGITNDKRITPGVFSTAFEVLSENTGKEVPSGLINGVNDTYTVSRDIIAYSTDVYLNGVTQKIGLHYTELINGIIFESSYIPRTGDIIEIKYRY